MPTLLEQAKQVKQNIKPRINYDNEEMLDLAIAWLNGEISTKQIQSVLRPDKKASGSSLYKLFSTLKWAIQAGKMKVERINYVS